MAKLGAGSLAKLGECHPDLQRVVRLAVELMPPDIDCTVLCGWRGKLDQQRAFRDGKSKLQWPESRHNSIPAEAVDLAPYPIDWNDRAAFVLLASYVLAAASDLGIRVSWGGHWRGFPDLPHFELS
jgi:peptidoglycan L-alanyl-D-glutamate endopeptidase CwlK